jgi:uncharacterized Zn-binding protein involved in type VI secretion
MAAHGGAIVGPGVPIVLIGMMPAAVMGDMTVCPAVTGVVPHVGGPITKGSVTVLIGGRPAARVSDLTMCTGGGIPGTVLPPGCPTVLIGG